MTVNYKLTKHSCYVANVVMAAVANFSPLLFIGFNHIYGFSYTLLGLLVLVNFTTQLLIDLIFAFFSSKFNIEKTVRNMPLIACLGFLIYSLFPLILPAYTYLFIVIGTIIFSVSSGLNEVLASPLIAAIPSDNPDREMSKLHSVYAWGSVFVIIISTLFIKIFTIKYWNIIALIWAIVPFINYLMFKKAPIPKIVVSENSKKEKSKSGLTIFLLVLLIFFGGASECTMSQWVSGYAETIIEIPKIWGDIFGFALFLALLGLGRTLYSKYGKNILKVLFLGMTGALICYITASVTTIPALGIFACAFAGLCTSMLWPGSLILLDKKIKNPGVAIYALMAAGGDLGASLSPQLLGIVSDIFGMRQGMIIASFFPLMGIILILYFILSEKKGTISQKRKSK